jgi:hypothetical protein
VSKAQKFRDTSMTIESEKQENYENFKVLEHVIDLRIGLRSAYPQHPNVSQERHNLNEVRTQLLSKIDDVELIQAAIKLHRSQYKTEIAQFENQYD